MSTSKKQTSKKTMKPATANKTAVGEATKKYYEVKINGLIGELRDANTVASNVKAALRLTEQKNRDLEATIASFNESSAKENVATIIRKHVIVGKLTNGFTVKEFTGARTSLKINQTGHCDLPTDVAASFESNYETITDSLVKPLESLLSDCGAGVNFYVKVNVVQMPRG